MADVATTTMLNAALWYADHGYMVFPCAPGRKTPITEHGLHDATTDPDQITRWWTQHPTANVAIRTDGLLIIDVDGEDNRWLCDEPDKLADLDAAPRSRTPRGGSHYFFRQPDGRAWRNTAGRLAHQVDTRANGGYVLVAPSLVEGIAYRWANERGLSAPPQRLPEPPEWLIERLESLGTSVGGPVDVAAERAIPNGRRNSTLAQLAGTMRRVGMTRAEILAAIQLVNTDRCKPPLPLPEIERIAASIARYEPNTDSVTLGEHHEPPDRAPSAQPRPLSVGELMARHRTLRAPVIHGLVRRGETMNLIAPPKTGKSWLVLGLAMCVATGRPWLDTFATIAGHVLIVDNELHAETLAHRIPQVAECLRIGMNDIAETMHVQSMRGQLRDIFSLGQYFESLAAGCFALVVLDAFYRFIPREMNENDNATMATIYNCIDSLADRLGCSFVLVHHATKGNQSAKAVTDVGAGAGSQSRATDTHLILRPHQDPYAVVLDAAVRSWPPIEPIPLRWSFPVWKPAPDLDPAMLQVERKKRGKPAAKAPETPKPPSWTVAQFVESFLTDQPATKPEIHERTRDAPGLSGRRVDGLLRAGESQGLIKRTTLPGRGGPMGFARCKPEASE